MTKWQTVTVIAALPFLASPAANAFGTVRALGQDVEHRRITHAAFAQF